MSNCTGLELSDRVVRAMVAHAEEGATHEAVGLLGGRTHAGASVALQAVPLTNLGGADFFVADPHSQYLGLRKIHQSGYEVVAVYHSHPGGAPVLSPLDRLFAEQWARPHLVISEDVHAQERWRFTAWLVMAGAGVRPVPVTLGRPARVDGFLR